MVWRAARRPCRGRSSERGQALAEFVIVAPVLLLILMATVGFGHAIFTRMIVVQAANRAARLGAVLYGDSSVSSGQAHSRTRQAALSLLSASLQGNDREVVIKPAGNDLHVTVRYRTRSIVPLLGPWLGEYLAVEHEAIYRIELDTA